jgi:hypothetical protein
MSASGYMDVPSHPGLLLQAHAIDEGFVRLVYIDSCGSR